MKARIREGRTSLESASLTGARMQGFHRCGLPRGGDKVASSAHVPCPTATILRVSGIEDRDPGAPNPLSPPGRRPKPWPATKPRRPGIKGDAARPPGDHAAATRDHATAVADHTAATADQAASAADQSASDVDQTLSDKDQSASTSDQLDADQDQRASDRDQASADRDHKSGHDLTAADQSDYNTSREERDSGSYDRLKTRLNRSTTAQTRDATADQRDQVAETRDEVGVARDARATDLARIASAPEASLTRQLEELAAKAAADRARAAADRARAARDRASRGRTSPPRGRAALGPPRRAHRRLPPRDGSTGALQRDRPGPAFGRAVRPGLRRRGSSQGRQRSGRPRGRRSRPPEGGPHDPGAAPIVRPDHPLRRRRVRVRAERDRPGRSRAPV